MISESIIRPKEEVELSRRGRIFDFEEAIKNLPEHYEGDSDRCPLKHSFADGMYVREIFIPAGEFITGKVHKHSHPNFLLSGTVIVYTESKGQETLVGPCSMISPPGTKRALYAVTDLRWVTVHLNLDNGQNLERIEKYVIAEDYKEYEKFRRIESNRVLRFFSKIKNLFL